ncbi:MAG: cation:proton antiporter domain-containing protein [Candidatus Saccharicenans sp.]|uniref:cation:proton antiporter domain-containing protein n=1 Tax=Candidatus Saccharicenans sp. TaxID=2819258 RepID=UPI00404A4DEF
MALLLLRELITILAASILVIVIFHRLKIPAVVGFLITGILLGPGGLSLVRDLGVINAVAEIGVMMLLFIIGIEFSLERLQRIQRYFWLGGGLQVLITIIAVSLISRFLGAKVEESLVYGFLVALSSTAVVLKLLSDKKQLDAPQGQISMGITIFQDMTLVPMLAIIPLLANLKSVSILALGSRFFLSLLAVTAVFFLARKIMPVIISLIVRTRIKEIFLLSALFACLGMAFLTSSLGLSLALGAFLAGIIISESSYSLQVVSDILPFKDVFNSLFFVSIGMLLDTSIAWHLRWQVLAVVVCIILLKVLVVFLTVRLLQFSTRVALMTALGLAQIGEFSFVLAGVCRENGLLSGPIFQVFVASSVLTILATPLLMEIGPGLVERVRESGRSGRQPDLAIIGNETLREHVIIAGFGLNGRNLARVLKETGITYVIIEINPDTFRSASQAGEPIIFGDVSSQVILQEAGIEKAQALVLAISDPAATRRGVNLARRLNPEVFIIVRTRFASEIEELYALGANDVIPEEFETSIEIFVRVLEKYHLPRNIINTQVQVIRGERYGILRGARSSSRRLTEKIYDYLEAGVVETFLVPEDSWINGRTLGEIDLRGKTGVTVIAVVRGDKTHSGPGANFRLEARDILVLVGDHQAMDRAFVHLGAEGGSG